MEQKNKKFISCLFSTIVWFFVFVVILIMVKYVDVDFLGENGTAIGLSTINNKFYQAHSTLNETFYKITKYMGYFCFLVMGFFALKGLIQLIKRKKLSAVDIDLLVLGGIYILTLAFYVFFELVPISFRPIIVEKPGESSFPSSHTFLTVVVMMCSILYVSIHSQNTIIKITLSILAIVFSILMIYLRALSGVHWFTDIVAGVLLGVSISFLYLTILLGIANKISKN